MFAEPQTHGAWPRTDHAWYVVVLLTLAYAFAILDRTSLALLIQPLQASLRIDDTHFGLLRGMAFSIVYSVFDLPLGLLADRRAGFRSWWARWPSEASRRWRAASPAISRSCSPRGWRWAWVRRGSCRSPVR